MSCGRDIYMNNILRELLSGRDVLSSFPARPASAAFTAEDAGEGGVLIAAVRSIPVLPETDIPPVPCFFADADTSKKELVSLLKLSAKSFCAVLFATPSVLLSDEMISFALGGSIRAVFVYDADVHMREKSLVYGTLPAACELRSHLPYRVPLAAFMLDFSPGTVKAAKAFLGIPNPALFGSPCPLFSGIQLKSISTLNIPISIRTELRRRENTNCVVYCRTRETAEITYNALNAFFIPVSLCHSGLERGERKKAAADYASHRTRILVCTYGYSGDIWRNETECIVFGGLPYDIPSVCRELLTVGDVCGEALFVYSEMSETEKLTEQELELLRLLREGITPEKLEWYLS